MRTRILAALTAFLLLTVSLHGCSGERAASGTGTGAESSAPQTEKPSSEAVSGEKTAAPDGRNTYSGLPDPTDGNTDANEEDFVMQMKIGDTVVSVAWENNASVEALKELCAGRPLTVQMSMYGGFEQVGYLGTSLPRNDVQTVTHAGDIVLYSGDQIVVFYGSNSWAYTRLGHITDRSQGDLRQLLGNGDVTVTIGNAD